MARLLLISLGKLTGALLEAAARDDHFDEIIIAGRQSEYGRAKANQARIGAALEGHFPEITFERFDFNEPGAGLLLLFITGAGRFSLDAMLGLDFDPRSRIAASR